MKLKLHLQWMDGMSQRQDIRLAAIVIGDRWLWTRA
jgi:hypothetical protein